MDEKYRWGGVLETPIISKIQRNILDLGRRRGLEHILSKFSFLSVIDIGCGLGETSQIFPGKYMGVDNSFPRVAYAARKYPAHHFLVSDAQKLCFCDQAFDAAIMIDTSHHLSDTIFCSTLSEMIRLAKRYVVVSDPISFKGQSKISRWFYRMDRGGYFRTEEQMRAVFSAFPQLVLEEYSFFQTFPGLYRHAVFVFRIQNVRY